MNQQQSEHRTLTRGAASGRFSADRLAEVRLEIAGRLREAFDGATNAEIARRLGTSDAAIKNYMDGQRFPAPEILLEAGRVTGINLHWLLTGDGPKRVLRTGELFNEDQEQQIRELAARSGRTFEDQVKALAIAGVEFWGKI